MRKKKNQEEVIFGGGSFWFMDAIFRKVLGVYAIESGYAGGTVRDPTYIEVEGGMTDHAQVIRILYDPEILSYAGIFLPKVDYIWLFLHFHDPTTLNRQGFDEGPHLRSIILYRN
jgi:peptide-methionine (S)-S-oxide reductase